MRLIGQSLLRASAPSVLRVLSDPEELTAALPSADDFEWRDRKAGIFGVTIRPSLALGELPVTTVWTRAPAEPNGVLYHVTGRSDEHWFELMPRVAVNANGDTTRAEWSVDCQILGALRGVGERVLPGIISAQARLVLDSVERRAAQLA